MEYSYKREKPGRIKVVLITLVVVAITVSAVFIGWQKFKTVFKAKKQESVSTVPANEAPQKVQPTSVAGWYLFNGTTVWARAVEKYARGDYNQPFSQLDTFDRAKYDGWSTDFECPITNNIVPYETQVNNLVFNCRPEFLPSASKYFNLYDLANNHTDNQGGQVGLAETRKHLDKTAGVQYFGNFDPTVTKDICEVMALPVRLQKTDKTEEKSQLPVAFCAWHYFNYFRGPRPDELAVVKQYSDVMPVFGFVEMGTEYHASASDSQRNIAHQLVDAGLDVLFANNPHWVQDAEAYKGKLITYSLGNFIFDQLDTETQRSASIDTTLLITYDDTVAKWLALGPSCASFHDGCLQAATEQGLKKVNFTLKYAVIAGQGGAGKVTHRADAETQAAVESRMNWAEVSKALGQSNP